MRSRGSSVGTRSVRTLLVLDSAVASVAGLYLAAFAPNTAEAADLPEDSKRARTRAVCEHGDARGRSGTAFG
jgi:hypothetical protein